MKKAASTISITTLVTPAEKWQSRNESATIVIDVLRATTSIVVALCQGAGAVYPVASIPAARKLARSLPGFPLLAGERNGLRIPGFDLGNSPLEFQSSSIPRRPIVMCTTNGTKAIRRFGGDNKLYTAALVNMEATARLVSHQDGICLVCSGKEGKFSLEDAFCAGGIISQLKISRILHLDDGSLMCLAIWDAHRNDPLELLRTCNHGIYLQSLGMTRDLEFCAQLNVYAKVPVWTGEKLVLDKQ